MTHQQPASGWWWLDQTVDPGLAPALLSSDGDVVSRQELAQRVHATAFHLGGQAIYRGDRLALVMAPGPALAISLLGAMAVAGTAPLVPTSPVEVFRQDLRRLRVTRVLVDDAPPPALLEAARRQELPLLRLNPFELPDATGAPPPLPAPDDLALLLQTSGTTSQPKVVPLSHANLLTSARSVAEVLMLNVADRSLAAMPLFHIHGIEASLLAPLLAGGSVICCRTSDPQALLKDISVLQPTWLSAVPTLLQALLAELTRRGDSVPTHRLKLLRSSSSPLPPAVFEQLEATFQVPVLEAYGMTEAAHQICSNRLPGMGTPRRPGSVGRPAGPEVVVLGGDLRALPDGQVGEVAIRGANVTAGYEDAVHSGWIQAKEGGSWFLTGDEGWFDADGCLHLSGRLKEMINRGGEKVIPRLVDEALLRHPAVAEALAFALPHPTLGEDVGAAVVLRPGATADEQELRRHAFSALAPYEVPSRIVFLKVLPRGATGKLQRIGLAERLGDALLVPQEPPDGEMEELVGEAFAAVLPQAVPGRHGNFFQLGGDSLSGMRVISRLAERLGLDLPPALLFRHPSVLTLAERLDQLLDEALTEQEEAQ
jgi:acyl-CoA synthetase (AMP-forming)/AMP-acid ligase II